MLSVNYVAKETVEFCNEHNRLFAMRHEWMVKSTCISSYIFSIGYTLILLMAITNKWRPFAVPTLLFMGKFIILHCFCLKYYMILQQFLGHMPYIIYLGGKINNVLFYHYMEFTSDFPPTNLIPYFSVEGIIIL